LKKLRQKPCQELDLHKLYKIRKALYKKDAETFIEKCVYIEDRDSPTLAVPFSLWQGQKDTLQAFLANRLNIVLKARQLGLTWLSLAYAVWRIVFTPGYAVTALSKREEDAKELVRRATFILRYLPEWLIREKKKTPEGYAGPTWESTTMSITIAFPGAEPATFQSMTSSPDSGRSFTASLVILDEWAFQQWAEEIWSAAYPTINRPSGGQVIGVSTAKRLTLFEDIWTKAVAGKNRFKAIFLPWRTDPRRTEEWYEETKQNLPSTYMQEYPNTAEEAFSAGDGTAFPEFNRDIHVCEPFSIPKHWKRWMCCDNGYDDPFAWYWLTVSEDGTVFIYREFTRDREEEKLLYSDQAKRVVELSTYTEVENGQEKQVLEKIEYIVAGLDAWNTHHRDQTGKSLIDYYRDGGIKYGFQKAITDRRLRKSTLHEYLKPYVDENTGKKTAKLQIFSSCKKLIEILPQLPKDEKDAEKVADCAIDHPYDAVGYGLIAYHTKQTKPLKPKLPPEQQRVHDHIQKMIKNKKKRYKRYLGG